MTVANALIVVFVLICLMLVIELWRGKAWR